MSTSTHLQHLVKYTHTQGPAQPESLSGGTLMQTVTDTLAQSHRHRLLLRNGRLLVSSVLERAANFGPSTNCSDREVFRNRSWPRHQHLQPVGGEREVQSCVAFFIDLPPLRSLHATLKPKERMLYLPPSSRNIWQTEHDSKLLFPTSSPFSGVLLLSPSAVSRRVLPLY